jgi:hypothetical protein
MPCLQTPLNSTFRNQDNCAWSCDEGFYFEYGECLHCDITSSCSPALGLYLKGCGGSSSGECAPCTLECPEGYYLDGCGKTSNGICLECSGVFACPTGEFRNGCGGISFGYCDLCPTCAAGQYLSGCNGTTAGSCLACPACPSGRYLAECDCEPCPVGTYPATGRDMADRALVIRPDLIIPPCLRRLPRPPILSLSPPSCWWVCGPAF